MIAAEGRKTVFKIDGHGIQVTRGDSCRFVIDCKRRDIEEGAKAVFTVKGTPWEPCQPDIEKIIDVMNGEVHVILDPADTDITPGNYVWDVRIKEKDEVWTPMEYAAFRVLEAIGE